MGKLNGTPAADYKELAGWVYWKPDEVTMCSEGWKLHVGGKTNNAQQILTKVLPALQVLEIAHKFLPDTESFGHQTDEQAGKWFTVYPSSVSQAFMAVSAIDDMLPGYSRENDAVAIKGDKPVGRTLVYTRYGGYSDRVVRNEVGKLVSDSVTEKPSWIDDPWLKYNQYANYNEGRRGKIPTFGPEMGKPFPRYNARGKSL